MTQNLARYIQIARHHIYGTPLDEEARMEQQRISAVEDLQTYVVRKIDISVRMEYLFQRIGTGTTQSGRPFDSRWMAKASSWLSRTKAAVCFMSYMEIRFYLRNWRIKTGSN
jgi:hypothetical protein